MISASPALPTARLEHDVLPSSSVSKVDFFARTALVFKLKFSRMQVRVSSRDVICRDRPPPSFVMVTATVSHGSQISCIVNGRTSKDRLLCSSSRSPVCLQAMLHMTLSGGHATNTGRSVRGGPCREAYRVN